MKTQLFIYQLINGDNIIEVIRGNSGARITLTPDETQEVSNKLQSFAKAQQVSAYKIEKEQ